MSSDQTPGMATAGWTPTSTAGDEHTCQGCGQHVTPNFARVFGASDGDEVFRCMGCTTLAALRDGAAANPDYEHRVDRGGSR